MKYCYTPQGVCSREMKIEIEGDTIQYVKIIGGCDGNTKGLCNLLKGMKVDEAIQKLKGIDCGEKGTSCPDQLARALEQAKRKKA